MKTFLLPCVILLFISAGCSQKTSRTAPENLSEEISDIFVTEHLDHPVEELLLSDAAQDIEIIPLEINENTIFRLFFNTVAGEQDIFIKTEEKILRFDKEGKFLNQIGKKGEGPEEILFCGGIGIDDKEKLVYAAAGLGIDNQVKTYTYQGEFVKSVRVAPNGACMNSSMHREDRNFNFFDNKFIFRRMLPLMNPSEDIWQIQVQDTSGAVIATFYDPATAGHEKEISENHMNEHTVLANSWSSSSPVQNRYGENINFMFDSNDTIYQYNPAENRLKPRYTLHCGDRSSFMDIHKFNKDPGYFDYTFVTDVLETKDYLYLTAEKDHFSYLLRVDKKTGEVTTARWKGEIKESPAMKIKQRKVPVPAFTNDLCGGLPFFPHSQNEKQWIEVYDAPDLLEKIDLNQLKNSKVLFPEKRDQLVRILENLKEDDNPVVMIVTLK